MESLPLTDMQTRLLENLVELLELPPSAYELARQRFEDIGQYLGREGSVCAAYDPHVSPQGSFRLGTANRPLDDSEHYDLDLACRLSRDIDKATHTQEQLKNLVGQDLRSYRTARGIQELVRSKHRCWRIGYQDTLRFHMDIVPCIPAGEGRRQALNVAMVRAGQEAGLAADVARFAVCITDDRLPEFRSVSENWLVSNPEGYARWFEDRMRLRSPQLMARQAALDELPVYRRKMPLQRSVQLLKRHRDQMFRDEPDRKPVSVIITTLAAMAYAGELDLGEAMKTILRGLMEFAASGSSEVPNPVNPAENFADCWTMAAYRHLRLRENFGHWAQQAAADFHIIASSRDPEFIRRKAANALALTPAVGALERMLGVTVAPSVHTPKTHEVREGVVKPWRA